MGALVSYLKIFLAIVLHPHRFFEERRDIDYSIQSSLIVALLSITGFGILNGTRAVLDVSLREFTPEIVSGVTGFQMFSAGLQNFLSGFGSIILSMAVTVAIVHALVFLMGGRSWRKTFHAIAYASPVLLLTGAFLVLYHLFQVFVVGFPGIKFLGSGILLLYGAYVQARGIESLYTMSFGSALIATMIPAILKIALFVASSLFVLFSLLSPLR